jgi:predicted nucleotidyltransferase
MNTPKAFLEELVRQLEDAGVPYMVAGSVASSFHGVPRSTQDVDVVISPAPENLRCLVASLKARMYVDEEAARDAMRRKSMFNVIDLVTGWKADLIFLKDTPFSAEEFARRKTVDFQGVRLCIISAEDVILSKLDWARKGESDRQLRDATSVASVLWQRLDPRYLRRWAQELSVMDLLEKVMAEAERAQKPD